MKRIVPNPLSTFTQAEQWEYQYAKSGTAGLATTFGTAGITCAANEIALVDKIEIGAIGAALSPTVLTTALTSATTTSVICSYAIPTSVPATGSIRIVRDSGHVSTIAYTSYTGSTFTIASTDFSGGATTVTANASVGAKIYFPMLTKVTCEVNGEELYFNIPCYSDERRTEQIVWEPAGNLVVHPSGTMKWKASIATSVSVTVTYRKMLLTKAAALGYLSPTLPNVASTNAVSGSGLTAGTAKAIVAATAGSYVEILGFTCTGHSFNTAQDNIALGFWDGTTGSFAANANKVFRAYACGASTDFAPKVIVHNTDGCIRGPVGQGLYVVATTNLASTTAPKADFNVLYRLVPAPVRTDNYKVATALTGATETAVVVDKTIPTSTSQTGTLILQSSTGTVSVDYTSYTSATFTIASTDFSTNQVAVGRDCAVRFAYTPVNEPTGATGQAANRLSKWWSYTEAEVVEYATNTTLSFFATTIPACQVKVHGSAMSFISGAWATALNTAALWGGATITGGSPFGNLIPLDSDGNGGDCSRHYVSDQFIVCNSSQAPGFMTYEVNDNEVDGRSQLAWGTFGSRAATGSDYISAF